LACRCATARVHHKRLAVRIAAANDQFRCRSLVKDCSTVDQGLQHGILLGQYDQGKLLVRPAAFEGGSVAATVYVQ
jgi:hypothetical protein